jgi:hypothetical protein
MARKMDAIYDLIFDSNSCYRFGTQIRIGLPFAGDCAGAGEAPIWCSPLAAR